MKRLWISTCQSWPNLPENLIPFVQQLETKGIEVIVAPWQHWQDDAEGVLPLCAWDYAANSMLFRQWLKCLEQQGCTFFNPLSLVQWNMSKDYLLDLAKVVDVIPTQVFYPENYPLIIPFLQQNSWEEVVVKPLIGQSGQSVQKYPVAQVNHLLNSHDYPSGLVMQPYIAQIERYGETSMVFFNGEFSHAVKRQPPQGEWRANSAYGVQVYAVEPSQEALNSARAVLQSLPTMPLYARVDGTDILGEQRFLLNELEVIEPALYLHTCTEASTRFVQAILSKRYS